MIIKTDGHGEILFQRDLFYIFSGSHDNVISIKTDEKNNIYFSGNPSKFLQGHNVFGSDDCLSLVVQCLKLMNECSDLNLGLDETRIISAVADARITRVDINYSYCLGSVANVRSFIRSLEHISRSRHGRSELQGSTLYFGKTSKRWSIKMYSKSDELNARQKGHALSDKMINEQQSQKIKKFASSLLRIELTLRSKELEKLNIKKITDLQNRTEELFMNYVERLEVSVITKLADNVLMAVPASSRPVYTMWFEGYDVRAILPKSSYYNHRRVLLRYGINISVKSEKALLAEQPTLDKILSKGFVDVPLWAHSEGLVAV
jgi:II/X family phage/plasmid replication protein